MIALRPSCPRFSCCRRNFGTNCRVHIGRKNDLKSVCKGTFHHGRSNDVVISRADGEPLKGAKGGSLLKGTGPSFAVK